MHLRCSSISRFVLLLLVFLMCSGANISSLRLIFDQNQSFHVTSSSIISPPIKVSVQTLEVQSMQLFIDAGLSILVNISLQTSSSAYSDSSGLLPALSGITTVEVICGYAVFTDLVIDLVGYFRFKFAFVSPSIPNQIATSSLFQVFPGVSSYLAVITEPFGARPDWPFQQQPVVVIRDSAGNLVTNSSLLITVSIAVLVQGIAFINTDNSDPIVQARSGIANFGEVPCLACAGPIKRGLSLSIAYGGAILRFSALSVSPAESSPFDVSLWPPIGLSVAALPTSVTSGVHFTAKVALVDSFGYLVSWTDTGEQINVTARLRTRVNVPNTLHGTLFVAATDGLATFTDLTLGFASGGYLIDFTAATSLPQVLTRVRCDWKSSPFEIAEASTV